MTEKNCNEVFNGLSKDGDLLSEILAKRVKSKLHQKRVNSALAELDMLCREVQCPDVEFVLWAGDRAPKNDSAQTTALELRQGEGARPNRGATTIISKI